MKYLESGDDATIYDDQFAAENLQALGGRQHANALTVLRDLAEEGTRRKPLRGIG